VISVEKVDFVSVPVSDYPAADAWFRDTLALWERNPRSSERWVEYEAPNVTIALVPDAYRGGDERRLPFASLAVRVDDVAVERERMEEAGVEFSGRTFDSGVCNGAIFAAPDANSMLLHRRYAKFADGRAPDAPGGRIDFVAVPTRDRARAEEFYGGLLGLERNPNSSERWVEYEAPNLTVALVDPSAIGRDFAPLPGGTIAFRVPDVEAAREALVGAGVESAADVIDSGVCHIGPFEDPDGNGLMLHRRYAPFSD
jgi:catechol 2,3-dioxygenase-like lactoylglutathione lyase family enzyme